MGIQLVTPPPLNHVAPVVSPETPPPAFGLVGCPVCGGSAFDRIAPEDGWDRGAVRCDGCGLGVELTLPKSPPAYDRAWYDSVRVRNGGPNCWQRYHHDTAVAALRYAQLLPVLGDWPNTRRTWLDVGCSAGAFPAYARRRGWLAYGVESSPDFCEEVTRQTGLPVMSTGMWLPTTQSCLYDRGRKPPVSAHAVSFFDVLEHVVDPVAFATSAVASCHPDGFVIVEAPDLDAAEDFPTWKHRRVSETDTEHVWHFGEGSLTRLFKLHCGPGRVESVERPLPGRLQFVWRVGKEGGQGERV